MKTKTATSKEAIIGIRSKNIAMAKIGDALVTMVESGMTEYRGVANFCQLIKSDARTVKKHIGFRFYPQGPREDYVLKLDTDDVKVIKETIDTFDRLSKIGNERQRIAQCVFLYLLREGRRDSTRR